MQYELVEVELFDGTTHTTIKRVDEATGVEWFIPVDENNSDYQAYLVWKDGNN